MNTSTVLGTFGFIVLFGSYIACAVWWLIKQNNR